MQTEYKVITDYSLEHLQSTISTLMTHHNWKPIGGLSMVLYEKNPDEYKNDGFDTVMYAQALVR